MASGFLWHCSYIKEGRRKAKIKIIHVLKLYFIWSFIYFPFVLIQWIVTKNLNIKSLLLYLKKFIFEGSFLTIWFLNALWLALLLVYFLLKYFKIKTILFISLPCYLFSCLLSSYYGLFLVLPFGKKYF